MRLKRLLLGTLLGALPIVANADLVISNNTNQWSAVKIAGNCSGPTFATAPHQSPTYPAAVVSTLCKFANPCSAEVYVSKTCEAGSFVGTVKINTKTDIVSDIVMTNTHYSIIADGTHVSINFLG